MARYSADALLATLERLGDSSRLDLSGQDLRGIDLGTSVIQKKRLERGWPQNGSEPAWYSGRTQGIGLARANLRGAQLSGADLSFADLWEARLEGTCLSWCCLEHADLGLARLHRADLWDARMGGAYLRGADLSEAHLARARLAGAVLEGANLTRADLREADLTGAVLVGANLREAVLEGAKLLGVDLKGADLTGARLQSAHLEGVDLRPVRSLAGAYFKDAWLDQTLVPRDRIQGGIGEERSGQWVQARAAYMALKANFRNLGQYSEARWAYVQERNLERKKLQERLCRREVRALLPWLEHVFWKASSEYAESPLRVLVWLLTMGVVSFPILYWLVHGVSPGPVSGQEAVQWSDYALFSLRTMAGVAFTDLQPAGFTGKLLASIQGPMGVFGFALFLYTLARRMSSEG
ncbi:MAG: pentapeptide repeat-containing protein [Chloroflexi bacterium]|nr:pentapeptide repeat-containing protein [Chloroflexota bacterium]